MQKKGRDENSMILEEYPAVVIETMLSGVPGQTIWCHVGLIHVRYREDNSCGIDELQNPK